MEYVTCGDTEFVVRELPEKLRILNTIDPDSGDSLLVAQFKVCARVRACVHGGKGHPYLQPPQARDVPCIFFLLIAAYELSIRAFTNSVRSQGDV